MSHVPFLLYFLFTYYFQKILSTLDLECNQIGDEGAEHLARILKQNQVIYFPYLTSHSIDHCFI